MKEGFSKRPFKSNSKITIRKSIPRAITGRVCYKLELHLANPELLEKLDRMRSIEADDADMDVVRIELDMLELVRFIGADSFWCCVQSKEAEAISNCKRNRQPVVDFSAEEFFARASERLEHHQVKLSESTICKITLKHASNIQQISTAEGSSDLLPVNGSESIAAEVDGAMLPTVATAPGDDNNARKHREYQWKELRLAAAHRKCLVEVRTSFFVSTTVTYCNHAYEYAPVCFSCKAHTPSCCIVQIWANCGSSQRVVASGCTWKRIQVAAETGLQYRIGWLLKF